MNQRTLLGVMASGLFTASPVARDRAALRQSNTVNNRRTRVCLSARVVLAGMAHEALHDV
jgi:hypothetical protein